MIEQITTLGNQLLLRKKPANASETDPAKWVDDSFALAKSTVYMAPISDDNDSGQTISARPDAQYGSTALRVAKSQVLLAGYRLAELLNAHLK
jgi:hypothetical protein